MTSGEDEDDNIPTGVYFEMILDTNRGFQYPIPVYQGKPVEGSAGWYHCIVGEDGENADPLYPHQCTLQYKADTKELTVKADWRCQELDPARP